MPGDSEISLQLGRRDLETFPHFLKAGGFRAVKWLGSSINFSLKVLNDHEIIPMNLPTSLFMSNLDEGVLTAEKL